MHRRGKESDEAGESLRARRPVLGQCRIVEVGRGAANKIDGSSWTSAALSRIDRGSKTQLPLFGQPARSTTLATKFSRRHNPACVFHQSTQVLAVQGLTPQILSLYSAAATMMMRPLAPIPN